MSHQANLQMRSLTQKLSEYWTIASTLMSIVVLLGEFFGIPNGWLLNLLSSKLPWSNSPFINLATTIAVGASTAYVLATWLSKVSPQRRLISTFVFLCFVTVYILVTLFNPPIHYEIYPQVLQGENNYPGNRVGPNGFMFNMRITSPTVTMIDFQPATNAYGEYEIEVLTSSMQHYYSTRSSNNGYGIIYNSMQQGDYVLRLTPITGELLLNVTLWPGSTPNLLRAGYQVFRSAYSNTNQWNYCGEPMLYGRELFFEMEADRFDFQMRVMSIDYQTQYASAISGNNYMNTLVPLPPLNECYSILLGIPEDAGSYQARLHN